MILYVNGDSHTAGAEAANPHAFAEDDGNLFYMGRAPHPENLAVSWGKLLSLALKASFHCDAESASSNTRILRTTKDWLSKQSDYTNILLIIQWSTWEREEWEHKGITYQVNGSGIDMVPPELKEKYKQFVIDINWKEKTEQAHNDIWGFHKELLNQNIPHIFFNGNHAFTQYNHTIEQLDWGNNYIGPYDPNKTYDAVIRNSGIETVAPNSYHFGKDGHSFFHRFMLQYIIDNNFI
jgi:hypothetical protein